MGESVLSVCWKHHTSELAAVYKNLLESNFLVDCTISAEGQNLKAHRLVLSAGSPYFHELFSEETGKHPFVILLDASFDTLKAVIDFVYRGEAQIPEGNLKSFLTLAQSLQIKGLNAFTQDYENNLSSSTTENVSQESSEKNLVTSEVQGINGSQGDRRESYSWKHPHHFVDYTEDLPTNSCVPLKGCSALYDEVRPTAVMTPLQEQWRPEGRDDVSTAMQITVKNEPVFSAFSEVRNEKLYNVESDEPMSGNYTSHMVGRTSPVCGEEDLSLVSGYNETFRGNIESSEFPYPQQQLTQWGDQMSSCQDVAEENGSMPPAILVPKGEQLTYEEGEELIDYSDESGNVTNERTEEAGSACGEQNIDYCSRADALPPVDYLATPQQSGMRLWGCGAQESSTPLPHSELQLPEGQGVDPDLSAKGRKAFASSSSFAGNKPTHHRKHSCDVCGASFYRRSHLVIHLRKHTGERPYRCDECGKDFIQKNQLDCHKRTHTGERPFSCDVCGGSFAKRSNLVTHIRTHTGERPFTCDVCSASFTQRCNLAAHSRTHTGERPFRCDVCGASFTHRGHLVSHSRTHTGERPFNCDICGISFTQRCSLDAHIRKHKGERPFSCDVCGVSFTQRSHLSVHNLTHTGERPFNCDVCGVSFARRNNLVAHSRIHTGERPYRCDVCGKTFVQKNHLNYHTRIHTGECPYRCDVCDEAFSQKRQLVRHKRIHS